MSSHTLRFRQRMRLRSYGGRMAFAPRQARKAINWRDALGYLQGLATGVAVTVAAVALIAASKPQKFGTIDVERINVREPDGTLRLVIAGKGTFPGSFYKGEEIKRPDRAFAAGMLFMNDEGTENGGLIWSGVKNGDNVKAGASLTFDRYENDQTLQLLQTDDGGRDGAALIISDRSPESMFERVDGKPAIRSGVSRGAARLFVGKSRDKASTVMLQDAKGTPRLMLMVTPDGGASINFLDGKGQVVRTIGPDGDIK